MSGGGGLSGIDTKHKILACPRCHILMKETHKGEATLDECTKCGGLFFDGGEMFSALGLHADPSYWDRTEAGGELTDADIHCPRCDGHMLLQKLAYESHKVEIDRCGHCQGIWLDKGEGETVMMIGSKMSAHIDAERAKAQAVHSKTTFDDDLKAIKPGLIGAFLQMFKS